MVFARTCPAAAGGKHQNTPGSQLLQKRELTLDHQMLTLLLHFDKQAGCLEAAFLPFKLALHKFRFGVSEGLVAGQHAPDGGQQFTRTGSGRKRLALAFALKALAKVAVCTDSGPPR